MKNRLLTLWSSRCPLSQLHPFNGWSQNTTMFMNRCCKRQQYWDVFKVSHLREHTPWAPPIRISNSEMLRRWLERSLILASQGLYGHCRPLPSAFIVGGCRWCPWRQKVLPAEGTSLSTAWWFRHSRPRNTRVKIGNQTKRCLFQKKLRTPTWSPWRMIQGWAEGKLSSCTRGLSNLAPRQSGGNCSVIDIDSDKVESVYRLMTYKSRTLWYFLSTFGCSINRQNIVESPWYSCVLTFITFLVSNLLDFHRAKPKFARDFILLLYCLIRSAFIWPDMRISGQNTWHVFNLVL